MNALRALIEAARGVAATSPDKNVQNLMIDSARDLIDKLRQLLDETNNVVKGPSDPNSQNKLNQVN